MPEPTPDHATAAAFADSWNNLPAGSVYTPEQFADWMAPLSPGDFAGKSVLELGCGNGSLLVHAAAWRPASLLGIDLGESVRSARANLAALGPAAPPWQVEAADLVAYRSEGFDVAYCIGVLHHLADPAAGFAALVGNTRPGGRFHAWVYGREGNAPVRWLVEPLRRVFSRFPWWVTKYAVATPLAVPFFLYSRAVAALPEPSRLASRLPLAAYCRWIARRGFLFHRHVAFDQLVTPRTVYLPREEIERWLRRHEADIAPGSAYVVARNGNSWKFGGVRRAAP